MGFLWKNLQLFSRKNLNFFSDDLWFYEKSSLFSVWLRAYLIWRNFSLCVPFSRNSFRAWMISRSFSICTQFFTWATLGFDWFQAFFQCNYFTERTLGFGWFKAVFRSVRNFSQGRLWGLIDSDSKQFFTEKTFGVWLLPSNFSFCTQFFTGKTLRLEWFHGKNLLSLACSLGISWFHEIFQSVSDFSFGAIPLKA